jgi:hypothetical protein
MLILKKKINEINKKLDSLLKKTDMKNMYEYVELLENTKKLKRDIIDSYINRLQESAKKEEDAFSARVDITDENLMINESIQGVLDDLMDKLSEK